MPIPTVNFHLWAPCNMRCRFCFAPFHDVRSVLPKGHLPRRQALAVVEALTEAGFEKINFVGGEPLLCPWLIDLIHAAKARGLVTSIVTNGSMLRREWLGEVGDRLDWVGLSIDSATPEVHQALGRAVRSQPLTAEHYLEVAEALRTRSVRLKVNTVVTSANAGEDLAWMICALRPERWKVFQVLPVAGQNDGIADLLIGDDAYASFVERHRWVEGRGITLVAESNRLMRGSYAMVDPAGRFFDNAAGGHRYSQPILEVGVEQALCEVEVCADRFRKRGGVYA